MSYPGYRQQLQSDPAATRKGAWVAGGDAGYPAAVAQFDNWLYQPLDRRPALPPGATPPSSSRADASATGWQMPSATNLADIQRRYGTGGGSAPSTAWALPATTAPTRSATTTPSPSSSSPSTGFVSAVDTAPMASMNGAVAPAQNAMQRWQSSAQQPGLKPISDARRYFWATGQIDARAPQSDQNSTPAPVTFNSGNGHSAWTPDSGTNTSPAPVTFSNAGTGGHSNWEPGY